MMEKLLRQGTSEVKEISIRIADDSGALITTMYFPSDELTGYVA